MSKLLRSRDVKGNTLFDEVLRAWIDHKVELLPEAKQQIIERWEMVDKLIKHGITTTVMTADGMQSQLQRFNFAELVEWLKQKYNISSRQAYEDIANAKRFFLSCEGRRDIEYARGASIEHGEQMMWAAFDKGDFLSASQFYKELNKIKGLHQVQVELPDYSDFQPPEFVVTADATELGFEKIENPDEVVKRIWNERRREVMNDEAEDAEVLDD